jgi:hypothetical protein
MLVSFKWKISAHLIGIGGLFGALFFYAVYFIADFIYILMLVSLLSGAVAYARLQLKAHRPAQVYAGFLTGFIGMMMILYIGM